MPKGKGQKHGHIKYTILVKVLILKSWIYELYI